MRSSHRQILCVSCNFCWILQFCKWKARSRRKHNCTFLALRQEENNSWRSIIKEIRTSSRDKTVWVSNFVLPNLHIWVCGKIVRRRFSLIRKLSRKVERGGKDSCNFFVIEKQSRQEEMQPIKKNYFSCFVFSTCKENEVSFRWLINSLPRRRFPESSSFIPPHKWKTSSLKNARVGG